MPTRDTAWPDGTPCWVDLTVGDLGQTKRRYSHLFGWDTDDSPAGDAGYINCLKNGRPAAGLMSQDEDTMPAQWLLYFATSDVEATTARVEELGGRVIVPASDAGQGAGRMAVVADPAGAAFALWQAGEHIGFQIIGEPGTFAWTTLLVRDDVSAAKAFYGELFGFRYQDPAPGMSLIGLGDGPAVGGIHQADLLPDGINAAWNVHFGVASRDATVSMAEMEDDTDVLMSFDSPIGPEAVIRGPEGEVFNVMELGQAQA